MALGRFTDLNLLLDATVAGPEGGWAAGLPLTNLLKEENYVGAPARCLAATDLALSRFELVLAQPLVPNLFSIFFHTLSINARYRITGSDLADTGYLAPTLSTGWRWVYPSLYDPTELEPWQDNFISGTVSAAELSLLRRHLFVPLDPALVQRLRVEVDDQEHPDGWFDLGGAHLATAFSPTMNFDRGRELSVIPRDTIDVTPAGRRFVDAQAAQRVLSVSYSNLTDAEARRFLDAAMRARSARTVVFVPDLDDAAATIREAFPATFGKPPTARITWPNLAASAFTLEEILA